MRLLHKKILLALNVYLSVSFCVSPLFAQESFLKTMGEAQPKDTRSFGSPAIDSQRDLAELPLSGIPATGPGMSTAMSYNVHVLGDVARPGVYKILPSDRVTDAIKYAGGALPNGSERMIQLRRAGNNRVLDIYSYKFDGNLSQNPYLMENDVLFIPVKRGQFEIEGPVNRPGFYEILKPVSLKKAIQMSGNFSVGHSLKEPIRIIRFGKNEKKEIIPVPSTPEELNRFTVVNGDIIIVPHVLLTKKKFDYNVSRIPGDNIFYPTMNNNVYVIGAVSQAGPYPFQPNFNYKDYVSLAGPAKGSSIEYSKVIDSQGKKKNARKIKEINPGDTILVPSKTITVTNTLTWLNTITSLALTSFVFYDRFYK